MKGKTTRKNVRKNVSAKKKTARKPTRAKKAPVRAAAKKKPTARAARTAPKQQPAPASGSGPRSYETTVYIAAHQFYLQDAETNWNGGYTNQPWDDDGLGVAPGVVGVQSPRAAGHAPVFVEVHAAVPPTLDDAIQKVALASLELPSGRLKVIGEDNEESSPPLEIELTPGSWQVRVLFSGLETVTYDDDDGAEHYVVQLYPGPARESEVVRSFENVDDPVRTYVGNATVSQLRSALESEDMSARCRAIVDLARAGHTDLVADIVEGDGSRALRLAAANALRLVEARDALGPFLASEDPAIKGNVGRALERLSEA